MYVNRSKDEIASGFSKSLTCRGSTVRRLKSVQARGGVGCSGFIKISVDRRDEVPLQILYTHT